MDTLTCLYTVVLGFEPAVLVKYRDTIANLAVNDLGINRARLELRSGDENPGDYYSPYVNGTGTRDDWKAHRYESINDNDDPLVINPDGFHFAGIDHTVKSVILPLKQQLEANGEKLYISLNYVDFQDVGNFHHYDHPEEYAELILAAFLHTQNTYGWVPDAVEIILEPDLAPGWSAAQVGNALVATGDLLKANGFTPDFIVPSTTSMANSVTFFDRIIQVPRALEYISELSYHRYRDVSDATLSAIGDRAVQHNIQTAHLEKIGATYLDLHKDLTLGRNSSWAQYALADAFPGAPPGDGGGLYYFIDISDLNNPTIQMAKRTKLLRQYFKFIRRGAVRIAANSNDSTFEPLAFVHENGTYVVIVKANGGGDFSIQDLPAGTYGIKYTTTNNCEKGGNVTEYDIDLPDVTIADGGVLNSSIPKCGISTIYAKTVTNPTPTPTPSPTPSPTTTGPSTVMISGPTSGGPGESYTFVASTTPEDVDLPLTYIWQANDHAVITQTNGITDSVTLQWNSPGNKAITIAVSNDAGTVADVHLVSIQPQMSTFEFDKVDYAVGEGDSAIAIQVKRSGAVHLAATIAVSSGGGSATEGIDYTIISETLDFVGGQTTQSVSIPILDDELVEGNELIELTLKRPSTTAMIGANGTAVVTIVDDDSLSPGVLQFISPTFTLDEDAGSLAIEVRRTGGTDGIVSVDYATTDGTATSTDYIPVSGTLTLTDSQTTASFMLAVKNDAIMEEDETVNLSLRNPNGGVLLGQQADAVLVIVND